MLSIGCDSLTTERCGLRSWATAPVAPPLLLLLRGRVCWASGPAPRGQELPEATATALELEQAAPDIMRADVRSARCAPTHAPCGFVRRAVLFECKRIQIPRIGQHNGRRRSRGCSWNVQRCPSPSQGCQLDGLQPTLQVIANHARRKQPANNWAQNRRTAGRNVKYVYHTLINSQGTVTLPPPALRIAATWASRIPASPSRKTWTRSKIVKGCPALCSAAVRAAASKCCCTACSHHAFDFNEIDRSKGQAVIASQVEAMLWGHSYSSKCSTFGNEARRAATGGSMLQQSSVSFDTACARGVSIRAAHTFPLAPQPSTIEGAATWCPKGWSAGHAVPGVQFLPTSGISGSEPQHGREVARSERDRSELKARKSVQNAVMGVK